MARQRDSRCAPCCDLPDQTVHTLAKFNYVFLILKVLIAIIVGAAISRVGRSEDEILAWQLIASLILTFFAGVYGTWARDRGWLMAALVFEIWGLSTVTTFGHHSSLALRDSRPQCGLPTVDCGSYISINQGLTGLSFITFVVGAISAWINYRLSEKIQSYEETHETNVAGDGAKHGCCNLPDQTVKSLRNILTATGIFSILLGAGIFALAIALGGTEAISVYLLGITLVVVAILALVGAWLKVRKILLAVFTAMMWDISKMNPILADFLNRRSLAVQACGTLQDSCDAVSEFNLIIAAMIVALLMSFVNAWLTLRISELIQGEKLNDASYRAGKICGKDELSVMGWLLGAVATFQVLYAITIFVVGAVTDPTTNGIYHFWFAPVVLFQAGLAFYGALTRDRGWLILLYIMTIWSIGQAWAFVSREFASKAWADIRCSMPDTVATGCPDDVSLVVNVDIALVAFYVVLGLLMATLAVELSEKVQDVVVTHAKMGGKMGLENRAGVAAAIGSMASTSSIKASSAANATGSGAAPNDAPLDASSTAVSSSVAYSSAALSSEAPSSSVYSSYAAGSSSASFSASASTSASS